MKPEDQKLALQAIEQQFLTDAIDGNRFLDLMAALQNSPDEFWETYLDDPNGPIREEAKLLLAKLGKDATFADLKAEILGKYSSTKSHTRSTWRMRHPRRKR